MALVEEVEVEAKHRISIYCIQLYTGQQEKRGPTIHLPLFVDLKDLFLGKVVEVYFLF